MSLIKCPECGREISSFAGFCPHCGFPMKKTEEKPKKEENRNLVSLYKFSIQKSVGTPIGMFILIEVLVIVTIVICAFGGWVALAIALFICSIIEIMGIVGMITDIVLCKRLNRLSGKQLQYDPASKRLIFEDVNRVKHEVLVANVVKLDGPTTLSITFKESMSEATVKVMIGNTCREDVLKLREKIQELTDRATGFTRRIPPIE